MSGSCLEINGEAGEPARTEPVDWRSELARAITDPAELVATLGLDPSLCARAAQAAASFSLLVPRPYLARIRPRDPNDPLLVQVLPQAAEMDRSPRFTCDPLGEADPLGVPGLLQKYIGRTLIVATGRCAVHCRFCFRRHFPYQTVPQSVESWNRSLARIAADDTIHEVILSGGDPLMLVDAGLATLVRRIAEIGHVERLRVHSRLPIMIPSRINDALIETLRSTRLTPFMVVHVNHPAEIDREVADAFGRLVDAGVLVLSQSVLLRGVNDSVDVLAALFERFVDLRVMPYYLHQLDPVAGAAHFEVREEEGIALIDALRARLPGYAVPRYVRELPGGASKKPLG